MEFLFTNWPLFSTLVDVIQEQLASWLKHLKEYHYGIQHQPGKQPSHAATSCLNGMSRIMENAPAEPQATTVTGRLYSSEDQKDVKNVWSPKKVAQAQTQNPDIGPVVDPLSHIRWNWRNQLIRSSNPCVEQQGKSEHSGNFKNYEKECVTCRQSNERCQLRAEWF